MDEFIHRYFKRKSTFACLIVGWIFILSCVHWAKIGWTPDVLCAMECLDVQAETRPLEGSSSLRLLTRPCLIWPLCFSSSPTSFFVISLHPTSSHHSILYLSLLNMFISLSFSKPYLFCLQCSLLAFLGFSLSFIQVRSQFILLGSHPWTALKLVLDFFLYFSHNLFSCPHQSPMEAVFQLPLSY